MVNRSTHLPIERWFYIFLIIHVVVWTLAPTLVRFDLPLDTMEGSTWGHQLEWGYDKNPFMNAWLTALALKLDHLSGWGTYLFSQLSVAAGFWAIWQLGKKILPPIYALLAVLLLEGVQYYHLHAIDFNDNTLEVGLWALTIYFFYQALHQPTWRRWLLTGALAGASMMTKYYTAVLLMPMALLMLHRDYRHQFKRPAFYGGVILFILMMLPHIQWLFTHEFITIFYAMDRVSSPPTLWNHLFFPSQFAWQQLETFLPVLVLYGLFLFSKQKNPSISPTQQDKRFLLWIGLGPFFLTLLLSAIVGMKLRAAWGQPLLTCWSILLLVWLRPLITPTQFYRYLIATITLTAILVSGYCIALIRADEPSSANYPGKIIATQLTQTWHQRYHTPITFIAGSRWLAGNIALFSPDRPAVYIDWNPHVSTWINESELQRLGGIFVWDLSENHEIPYQTIKGRFPRIGPLETLHFTWLRNSTMAPVSIQVAFLPPQSVESTSSHLAPS